MSQVTTDTICSNYFAAIRILYAYGMHACRIIESQALAAAALQLTAQLRNIIQHQSGDICDCEQHDMGGSTSL